MKKFFAFLALSLMAAIAYANGMEATGGGIMLANLLAFAIPESEMTPEQKQLLGTIEQKFNTAMEQFKSGLMGADEVKKALKDVGDDMDAKLKVFANFAEIEKSYREQAEKIQQLAEAFDRIKANGGTLTSVSEVERAVVEFMDTPKFRDFVSKRTSSTGAFELSLKGVVGEGFRTPYASAGHTGRAEADVNEQALNLRDLMNVDEGDKESTILVCERITSFDRNAAVVSENGELAESSLGFTEDTFKVSRIGTHMNLSRRMLGSKVYMVSFILNRLPDWVKAAENFQILFGDGHGDNLKGLTAYDDVKCASAYIAGGVNFAAGDIKSVTPDAGGRQAIVTLTNPNPGARDGMKVTFAGATNTALNSTFDVHRITDSVFAIDVVISTAEGTPGSMTAVLNSGIYHSVDDPNSEDAVNAIVAMMTFGQYAPNAIVLNPQTVFAMSTEKDTMGRKLEIVKTVDGSKYIGSLPVVELNSIPVGHYFAGDLKKAASLVDYSSLAIEFAEDVQTRLKNMVTVIAQEEVIMPVYMPFALCYGKLSDVMDAIKKPTA